MLHGLKLSTNSQNDIRPSPMLKNVTKTETFHFTAIHDRTPTNAREIDTHNVILTISQTKFNTVTAHLFPNKL